MQVGDNNSCISSGTFLNAASEPLAEVGCGEKDAQRGERVTPKFSGIDLAWTVLDRLLCSLVVRSPFRYQRNQTASLSLSQVPILLFRQSAARSLPEFCLSSLEEERSL
jgi:hypothetical protein